ncbi:hypothetical protein LOTGIDRAFT_108603 [Lottia gigantea]|uniref:G-protein coupled receptors family 3 profile domain-containing protein n=1 Tax=Lottia gigantea TaxID=225164 RepID=V3ZNA9_LOTGI|nr:hypothetical protein LOTGIDRAFT_108603 [Lottia gigantea]ESO83930.1 hypothetical protein LOTGIDRAFT_108603 [Lottia gigantea]
MLLVFLVYGINCDIPHPSDLPTVLYSQKGDLNIGIIVPMHYSSSTSMCSPNIRGLTNFQKAEAMAFAVKEINDRNDILPNTTLGFYMLDDCAKDTTAMARALHFTQTNSGRHDEDHLQAYNVVGVIGAESSRNSVQIADLLSLFQIPVISYISTSPALSDKDTYPYFSRIVPSDSLQMSVLMDIIIKFDWNYVSVVYEDGSYGYGAYKVFDTLMDQNKKCIAVAKVFKKRVPDEDVDEIINGLISKSRARIVILIVTTPDVKRIFQSVTRLNREGYFTWLGTDGWSFKSLTGYEKYMQGSLLVGFYGTYVERFDQYMKYLTPKNSTHNPWFKEFFEKRLGCTYGENSSCNFDENLLEGYLPSVLSGFAMDAVYAFARGLHNMIQNCRQTEKRKCVTGHHLLQYVRDLSFEGEHGLVSFDKNGDGSVTYSVKTLRKENAGYSQETIGLWDTFSRSFIKLEASRITWKSENNEYGTLPPISECSEFCKPGFQAVKTKPQCCWYCKPCRVNERSLEMNKSMTCVVCPKFYWPDDTKTSCKVIPVTDLSYSQILGTVLTLIVTILCIVIIALLSLSVKNRKTIVHQNRILTYFIIIANLVSCGSIIAFVVPPSLFSCSLIQFAFPMNFAINYCPFLVKTYGIFEMIKNNNGQSGPESGRVVPMFVLLLLVQVTMFITLTRTHNIFTKSNLRQRYKYVESACKLDEVGFMASLSYNLILLFICIYFTVRSKNVDASLVRDSKFNNILVYLSTVFWLGFVVSYFTTTKLVIQSIILCIMMLANSAMFVGLLFIPRILERYFPHEG